MIRSRALILAGLPIACFVLMFAYAVYQLVQIDRAFRFNVGENMLWAVTQTNREAQRVLLSIARQDPPETLQLRMDILHSRVALLYDNPQRAYYNQIGIGMVVDEAMRLTAEVDARIAAPDFAYWDDPAIASLEALDRALRKLSNDTVTADRNERGLRHDLQRGTVQLLLLSVLGAFASGVFIAGLLVRNVRQAIRAREDLEHHRAILEETVARRTQELQEALAVERRAKEVYRSFIITVPHQFRTPLSIIHMVAQRQLRDSPAADPATLEKKFRRILESAERLERLVAGIMTVVSMDARELTRGLLDLNAVADLALRQVRDAHAERTILAECTSEPLMTVGDAVLLEQVIVNLLSNAVKYSPITAPIVLRTWREGDTVRCSVQDRGIGIPAAAQGAIFERFFRAANAHHLPGMGVGLSLSRDIVTLHDGQIGFVSAEGGGSTFTVTLTAAGGE